MAPPKGYKRKPKNEVVNDDVKNVNVEEDKKTNALIDQIYGDLLDITDDEDKFFPSGSLVIDCVLSNGKGIPLGKFISINAEAAIGKSTMCLHIARNCCAKGFRCLYIDTECGLNKDQLISFSLLPFVENRTFIPKHIRTYRELDDLLGAALSDPQLKLIFIDSLTDIIPDQFVESNIADINQPALEARCQSLILKKYKYLFSKSGKTLILILQNRTKIAMGYGQQTTVQAAGGKAVEYHMDVTLELIKKEFLTRTVKGHDKPLPYGSECFLKANKNRYVPPKIPMQIQIIFGKGVSNSSAIANALVLNGIAKISSRRYVVDFEGETCEFIGKPKFEDFVKKHLDYYKKVIEDCGGIKLLPDSEIIQPVEVISNNDDNEESLEEGIDIEQDTEE